MPGWFPSLHFLAKGVGAQGWRLHGGGLERDLELLHHVELSLFEKRFTLVLYYISSLYEGEWTSVKIIPKDEFVCIFSLAQQNKAHILPLWFWCLLPSFLLSVQMTKSVSSKKIKGTNHMLVCTVQKCCCPVICLQKFSIYPQALSILSHS